MATSLTHPPTAQQIMFRDRFLEHGDPEKAYREAGYTASVKGMYRLLRAPWMDPHAAVVARAERPRPPRPVAKPVPVPATPEYAAPASMVKVMADRLAQDTRINDAVDAVLATPVHPLETRRGRALWLIQVMEGKIEVEKEVTFFDQEGQRQTEVETVVPDIKDRLKAAELLSKMSGDQVQKIDLKADVKSETTEVKTVYVHVDNGRGPALPISSTITGRDEVDACTCGAVYPRGSEHHCVSE